MTLAATTHLNFDGDARAALEFYASVFGGDLALVTYAMAHSADQVDDPERIIFGQVSAGDFRLMAYDVQHGREYAPGKHPFYVSARAGSDDEAKAVWDALTVDAAEILTPFGPSVWSSGYGMVTDRFGVTWIVDVAPQG